MESVVIKHKRTTLERAEKFISPDFFTDVNLYGKQYVERAPLKSLKHFPAPDRIPYSQAIQGQFSETKIGSSFGPTWSTHWFALDIEIPVHMQDSNLEIHLLWNSHSEAMIWQDGKPLQGLSGEMDRTSFPLRKAIPTSKNRYQLYVEMACNGLFGAGKNGLINPPDVNRTYTLTQAEIAVFDRLVYDLTIDVQLLHDMAKHMNEDSERGFQALYTVNQMINLVNYEDRSTLLKAHTLASEFFSQSNGSSQHTLHAMGHAHIDTAWLWPYAETIRKCARSWVNTIRLMEEHPDFIFTCSQAQQYEWLKEHYPSLYKEIQLYVKKGRFIPVGGSWVEMDGNIPSGESFIRQFLYGQRFFQKEFNIKCTEFWLPDTFGYSPQLPQIMSICGIRRFLTQKLSWSLINKFPHHTFWWEGIDGTSVLSHFPPGDNYCMKGDVKELLFSLSNYRDKGRSGHSVYLFGHGDGGQGPTEDMLQKIKRMKDVDGLPKVIQSSPAQYFSEVEHSDGGKLCRWRGELYLELHNGTYTTHAKVKQRNRKCEFLLHDLEFLSSVASILCNYQYPTQELHRLWKLLLLNQFHDVLPGSSIGIVYQDAHAHYKDIMESCKSLQQEAVTGLSSLAGSVKAVHVVLNTLGWDRVAVIEYPGDIDQMPAQKKSRTESCERMQIDSYGNTLSFVQVPSYGYTTDLSPPELTFSPATVSHHPDIDGAFILSNGLLRAEIDDLGRVTVLTLKGSTRNAINSEIHHYGNQFVIFDDIPLFWDAWDVMDYHLETRKPLENPIQHAFIQNEGPLRASLQLSIKISDKSYIKQVISLDAESPYLQFDTEVHWHESHKFLKVEFATSVHSNSATYEVQCGHHQRSNHNNTSWDWAQFEVCGHKWADISEFDFGVAVLNTSHYGYYTKDGTMRLSLLRSAKAPDEKADMGVHNFTYALMPHRGTFQEAGIIKAAYNLNCPLLSHEMKVGNESSKSYFRLNSSQVVIETIKKHEDHDNAIVVRLYESYGGCAEVTLTCALPFSKVYSCNGLEEVDDGEMGIKREENNIHLQFKPFQIKGIILQF